MNFNKLKVSNTQKVNTSLDNKTLQGIVVLKSLLRFHCTYYWLLWTAEFLYSWYTYTFIDKVIENLSLILKYYI